MKIKFSDESLSDLLNIEEYLLRNWNDRVLEDFFIKLDEKVKSFVTERLYSKNMKTATIIKF